MITALEDLNLDVMDPVERARNVLSAALPRGIGAFVEGTVHPGAGEAIHLIEPSSGATITTWADPVREGVEHVLAASLKAVKGWRRTSPFQRAEVLRSVSRKLEKHIEELALIETVTTGKPIRDTRVEASRVAQMFAYYAGWADKLLGDTIPVPGDWLTYTRLAPFGVVVAVTPWNAPLNTAGWNSAPALAAGNAVILKPSEFTPATSLRMAALAEEAGLPAGVLTVVPGLGSTVGAALTSDPRVGKVCFIGSVETGRRVATAAAAVGTPVVLELGGKSANIVFADADLEAASAGALAAIFAGAGQSCVAGSRLLVERSIHHEFVARLTSQCQRLRIGDPLDPNTEIGPIITAPQYRRVLELVDAGLAGGAVRATGTETPPHLMQGPLADGYWVMPTILDNVASDNIVERTEVFGPVLAVDTFDNEDEAVERANGTAFGLAGAVWTNDVSRAHRVADEVDAGTFWINSYKTIHVAVPFGGFGDSGWGRSSGPDVLAEYTQAKSVWVPIRPPAPAFPSLQG